MFFHSLKRIVLDFVGRINGNGKWAFVLSYIHNRHRWPHLKHPRDLSEIWIKRVLDGKIDEIYWLADKYAVRQYVAERGLSDILTPLLGVYSSPDEINFKQLPKRFAIKANFGAGHNIICTEKEKLDVSECVNSIREWMKPTIYSYSERHYNLIKKCIVCEDFIDDGTGGFPIDYKFMCIHGKVVCVLVCNGREKGHANYYPFSIDWQPMYDYYKSYPKELELINKPANFADMLNTAEILADNIELVRVDLYSNGSRIWFGEMTLTPSGCIFHRWSQHAMDEMGSIYNNKANESLSNL